MAELGTCYLVVNPRRREFLDPVLLLRSDRFAGVVAGPPAQAVLLLTCQGVRLAGYGLAGRWHGDPVLLVGDDEPADRYGVASSTTEQPDRNLYLAAEEGFEDISLAALAMLAQADPTLLGSWIEEAARDESRLLILGAAALSTPSPVLLDALRHRVAGDWQQSYRRAMNRDRSGLARRLRRAGGR